MWVMCVYVRAQYLNRKSGKYCFRLGKQRAEERESEREREKMKEHERGNTEIMTF